MAWEDPMSELLPVIETERLRLRALESADADDMAAKMTPAGQRLVYSSVRDRHEPTLFYELRRPGPGQIA